MAEQIRVASEAAVKELVKEMAPDCTFVSMTAYSHNAGDYVITGTNVDGSRAYTTVYAKGEFEYTRITEGDDVAAIIEVEAEPAEVAKLEGEIASKAAAQTEKYPLVAATEKVETSRDESGWSAKVLFPAHFEVTIAGIGTYKTDSVKAAIEKALNKMAKAKIADTFMIEAVRYTWYPSSKRPTRDKNDLNTYTYINAKGIKPEIESAVAEMFDAWAAANPDKAAIILAAKKRREHSAHIAEAIRAELTPETFGYGFRKTNSILAGLVFNGMMVGDNGETREIEDDGSNDDADEPAYISATPKFSNSDEDDDLADEYWVVEPAVEVEPVVPAAKKLSFEELRVLVTVDERADGKIYWYENQQEYYHGHRLEGHRRSVRKSKAWVKAILPHEFGWTPEEYIEATRVYKAECKAKEEARKQRRRELHTAYMNAEKVSDETALVEDDGSNDDADEPAYISAAPRFSESDEDDDLADEYWVVEPAVEVEDVAQTADSDFEEIEVINPAVFDPEPNDTRLEICGCVFTHTHSTFEEIADYLDKIEACDAGADHVFVTDDEALIENFSDDYTPEEYAIGFRGRLLTSTLNLIKAKVKSFDNPDGTYTPHFAVLKYDAEPVEDDDDYVSYEDAEEILSALKKLSSDGGDLPDYNEPEPPTNSNTVISALGNLLMATLAALYNATSTKSVGETERELVAEPVEETPFTFKLDAVIIDAEPEDKSLNSEMPATDTTTLIDYTPEIPAVQPVETNSAPAIDVVAIAAKAPYNDSPYSEAREIERTIRNLEIDLADAKSHYDDCCANADEDTIEEALAVVTDIEERLKFVNQKLAEVEAKIAAEIGTPPPATDGTALIDGMPEIPAVKLTENVTALIDASPTFAIQQFAPDDTEADKSIDSETPTTGTTIQIDDDAEKIALYRKFAKQAKHERGIFRALIIGNNAALQALAGLFEAELDSGADLEALTDTAKEIGSILNRRDWQQQLLDATNERIALFERTIAEYDAATSH